MKKQIMLPNLNFKPRGRKKWQILMPSDENGKLISLHLLARFDGTRLGLCLPLTPTQNTHDTWHGTKKIGGKIFHYSRGRRFRQACLTIAAHQVRAVIGRFRPPWTNKAEIKIVRCAMRPCDPSNITAGAKEAIDVLLISRQDRPGIGLLPDDGQAHVVWHAPENRSGKKSWGDLPGPGTWFFITKI